MDDIALAIAALECGHNELLADSVTGVVTPDAVDAVVARTGRRLLHGRSHCVLTLTADATAGADLVAEPIEISDHPMCVLALVLHSVSQAAAGPPIPGAGPVALADLARDLEHRGRDSGHRLIASLRHLDRLELLTWDDESEHVRVGPALAAQPPRLFESVEHWTADHG